MEDLDISTENSLENRRQLSLNTDIYKDSSISETKDVLYSINKGQTDSFQNGTDNSKTYNNVSNPSNRTISPNENDKDTTDTTITDDDKNKTDSEIEVDSNATTGSTNKTLPSSKSATDSGQFAGNNENDTNDMNNITDVFEQNQTGVDDGKDTNEGTTLSDSNTNDVADSCIQTHSGKKDNIDSNNKSLDDNTPVGDMKNSDKNYMGNINDTIDSKNPSFVDHKIVSDSNNAIVSINKSTSNNNKNNSNIKDISTKNSIDHDSSSRKTGDSTQKTSDVPKKSASLGYRVPPRAQAVFTSHQLVLPRGDWARVNDVLPKKVRFV